MEREIFFQGDKVGGAYNPVFEVHLRYDYCSLHLEQHQVGK